MEQTALGTRNGSDTGDIHPNEARIGMIEVYEHSLNLWTWETLKFSKATLQLMKWFLALYIPKQISKHVFF